MRTFSAKEAKNEFGRLIDTAQKESVTIEKKGRPVAIVISLDEYARFEALENAWWAAAAKQSANGGYLSASESEQLLASLLKC